MSTPEVYTQRRQNIRSAMGAAGLDALFVSHAANRFYLSGFELHDPQCNESAGYLLLTASGDDWLCTDSRYTDAAKRLWDENRIFVYGGDAAGQVRALIAEKSGGLTGFEPSSLSVAFYRDLGRGGLLVDAGGLVEAARVIKDADEIARMECSCALNHALMNHVPDLLVEGSTELTVSWGIEKFFREHGASELAFPNIVAFGPNGALPHAVPGEALLRENMPVLVDVGARYAGYCSDQTRTFWVGNKPSAAFARTLEWVRTAQDAAIACMEPGIPCKHVYATARKVFEDAGVAQAFTHGLGHGVGLEVHEAPSLSLRNEGLLRPGMVVTVEPGLYYPPWGGVRWEYMVLVEENGVRVL
ncbi:MAG: aminopeptidase P family protein [Desulfovibrionaceae bacterium]